MNFSVQQYYDQDTGRYRWAVLCRKTGTWSFPSRAGKANAERLAKRMNEALK